MNDSVTASAQYCVSRDGIFVVDWRLLRGEVDNSSIDANESVYELRCSYDCEGTHSRRLVM
jgi:hypothetical protein